MRVNIVVEAKDLEDAISLAVDWLENVHNLIYYPDFPMKAEWHRTGKVTGAELRVWVEAAVEVSP